MVDKNELASQLNFLYKTEQKIAKMIEESGLRFSINKLTAVLGEYYVYRTLSDEPDLFESIEPQTISNADFDLKGQISVNSPLSGYFDFGEIRIEVKTRRNQKGSKYLSSVKPEKFDLLCVVDIAANYNLNQIFFVKSETAQKFLDTKRQRLIFKEHMAFLKL